MPITPKYKNNLCGSLYGSPDQGVDIGTTLPFSPQILFKCCPLSQHCLFPFAVQNGIQDLALHLAVMAHPLVSPSFPAFWVLSGLKEFRPSVLQNDPSVWVHLMFPLDQTQAMHGLLTGIPQKGFHAFTPRSGRCLPGSITAKSPPPLCNQYMLCGETL